MSEMTTMTAMRDGQDGASHASILYVGTTSKKGATASSSKSYRIDAAEERGNGSLHTVLWLCAFSCYPGRISPGHSLTEQAAHFLNHRRSLLILDRTECGRHR